MFKVSLLEVISILVAAKMHNTKMGVHNTTIDNIEKFLVDHGENLSKFGLKEQSIFIGVLQYKK